MFTRKLAAVAGIIGCLVLVVVSTARTPPREPDKPADPTREQLKNLEESLRFAEDSLTRTLEEQTLFRRLEDLAEVDKVRYTGPPPRVVKNPTAQGAGNPVIISAYTFLPRKTPADTKLPLIVLVHGGV